jgi:hypothetical protein
MKHSVMFGVMAMMVSATAWAQEPVVSSTQNAVSADQIRRAVAQAFETAPETATGEAQGAGAPSDGRKFGLGIGGGGLSFGFVPSARYWMSDNVGLEVQAAFYSNNVFGAKYNQTAISPSVLVRFGSDSKSGDFTFRPYFGGGVTIWTFSSGYGDLFGDQSLTLGAFVGGEAIYKKWPRIAGSGSIGYYTSPDSLGFGGLFTSIGVHYYFK